MDNRINECLNSLRRIKQNILNARYDAFYHIQRLKAQFLSRIAPGDFDSVNRAILSTNLVPDYLFCAPLTILFWNRLCSYKTTLVGIGDEEEWHENPLGRLVLKKLQDWDLDYDLLFVPNGKRLSSGHLAQVMRLWAPTQFPEDFCLIGDIDMLPLSSTFFKIKKPPSSDVYLLNGDAYKPRERWCMCYIGAVGKVWSEIIGQMDALEAIEYFGDQYQQLSNEYDGNTEAVSGSTGWYNDETIFSELLKEWVGYPKRCSFFYSYLFCSRRRLNRSVDSWRRFEPTKKGYYVDGHVYRNGFLFSDTLLEIINAYLPGDYKEISNYVKEWNQIYSNMNHPATS